MYLHCFPLFAQIHLGSSLVSEDSGSLSSSRYNVGVASSVESNQLVDFVSSLPALTTNPATAEDDFFRGCLGQVRVGGVILPFFTQAQLANSTVARKFVMQEGGTAGTIQDECIVCFEQECQNGGTCSDPQEVNTLIEQKIVAQMCTICVYFTHLELSC